MKFSPVQNTNWKDMFDILYKKLPNEDEKENKEESNYEANRSNVQ